MLEKLLDAVDLSQYMETSLRVVLVLVLWWLLSRAVAVFLSRLGKRLIAQSTHTSESPMEARKRVETLLRLLTQIVRIVLFMTLALVLLLQLGVQIAPFLASAGIVGLAVGFGAQSLVKDVITGFFIVMENQMRVGDVVVINGTGGLVESMTLRTVVLRDVAGVVHIFTNGNINSVSNATRGWSAYVFEIAIGYREDPDQVIQVLRQVAAELSSEAAYKTKILEEAEIFGVDRLAETTFIIKGRIKTRPNTQWEIGREFLKRIKKAFEQHGIEIPQRQRTILMAQEPEKAMQTVRQVSAGASPAAASQPREEAAD